MRRFWCPSVVLVLTVMLHVLVVQSKQQQQHQQPQAEKQADERRQDEYAENDVNFDQIETLSSLSVGAFECLRNATLTHCLKLYVLQRMERSKPTAKWRQQQQHHATSLQQDFMQQLFGEETANRHAQHGKERLIEAKYMLMSEIELNARLRKQFERFFAHRELKLAHLLPGLMVKVVTSKTGKLQFSLKHNKSKKHKTIHGEEARAAKDAKDDEIDETLNGGSSADVSMMADMPASMKKPGGSNGSGGGGVGIMKKKNKSGSYKSTILQMAVPVMVMPAILMGSFLPFILPVLKMATIMTLLMNNSAFLAALIYAARTHASAQEEQHISYTHPAYH